MNRIKKVIKKVWADKDQLFSCKKRRKPTKRSQENAPQLYNYDLLFDDNYSISSDMSEGKRIRKLERAKKKKSIFNLRICKKKQQKHKKERTLEALRKREIEKKRKKESKKEALKIVEIKHKHSDLICPICLKFIANAVTTICGHTFCHVCINELLLISPKCLVCNKQIRKKRMYGSCKNLDNLIENMLNTMGDQDELNDYKKRKAETARWIRDKKVGALEVGKKIDIRSPEYIWCVGVIRRIVFKPDTGTKVIYVHYEGLPNAFDEELSEKSSRLAKYRFFTSRKGKFAFPLNLRFLIFLDIPSLEWSKEGKKVIKINKDELGYDLLGVSSDPYAGLIDSDESGAY